MVRTISICSLVYFLASCKSIKEQNKVIFEPVALPQLYTFQLPTNAAEVFIKVSHSVKLNALLFKSADSKGLILYFQGNAKNLQNFLDNHAMALDWGYDVLVADYRGFGKSTGYMKGQRQMFTDASRIYEYALTLGYSPDHIVLYGYSMGTSLATYLASTHQARNLILESPYSSIKEIAWVGDRAPAYKLNVKEMAKNVTIPTLIIHGHKDSVITVDHAHRVYDNLKTDRKKLVIIEEGAHGDLRQRPEYRSIITGFLEAD